MRTKDAMREYARGLAESHFYSYDDTAVFLDRNNYEDTLEEEIDTLAGTVYRAMVWVQEGEKT